MTNSDVWVTENGREILISDLHDAHLKNILWYALRMDEEEMRACLTEQVDFRLKVTTDSIKGGNWKAVKAELHQLKKLRSCIKAASSPFLTDLMFPQLPRLLKEADKRGFLSDYSEVIP